jgi:hypothetical protein
VLTTVRPSKKIQRRKDGEDVRGMWRRPRDAAPAQERRQHLQAVFHYLL